MSYLLDLLFPNPPLDTEKLQTRGVVPDDKFDGILSLFRYHPPLSGYLHNIKYDFRYSQADLLTSIAAKNIQSKYKNILKYWQNNNFIILPVPLHWIRKRWRGFNQSELLASQIAKKLNLNYDDSILKRAIFTKPQVHLNDFNRQLHFNNKNIFTLNRIPELGNYIIFDDVTTTNSTLSATLKPLLPHCQKHPWALTIAG